MNARELGYLLLAHGVGDGIAARHGRLFVDVDDSDGCVDPVGASRGVSAFGARWEIRRLVLTLAVGGDQRGLEVWASCRRATCCNPDHLSLVTARQRARRTRRVYPASVYAHAPQIRCSHCGSDEGTMSIQDDGGRQVLWQFRCALCARAYDSAIYRGTKPRPFHGRTKIRVDESLIDAIRESRLP